MSNRKRMAALLVLVLIGMAASLLIDPPAVWGIGALLVVVTCTCADQIIHTHWHVNIRRRRYMATIWILPGLLVAGSFLFLRMLVLSAPTSTRIYIAAVALAVIGALLVVTIVSQYRSLDRDHPSSARARLALNIIAYVTAFALYSAIYATKLRSIFSGTAVLVVTALICLELFRQSEVSVGRTWCYAAVVGLIVGEVMWVLNYWTIGRLAGGAALLICLYLLSGVVQSFLSEKLDRRTVAEFGTVTLLGFGLLLASGLRL